MKKVILVLMVMIMSMVGFTFTARAAKLNLNVDGSFFATDVNVKDMNRLSDVVSKKYGKDAVITNATVINETTWVVRLVCDNSRWDNSTADYVINIYPYKYDTVQKEYTTLPFKSVEEGTKMYGKKWFYFGVFDENTHQQCGLCVAERLNRFPDENDLNYTNVTYSGTPYVGMYQQTTADFLLLNASTVQKGLVSSNIIDTTK